jgi:hypothetical protein
MDIVQKYNSFRVIKSIEMSGHVACTGENILHGAGYLKS